jgi:hypothetical protein
VSLSLCWIAAAPGFNVTTLRECVPVRRAFEANAVEYGRGRRLPLFLRLAGNVEKRDG